MAIIHDQFITITAVEIICNSILLHGMLLAWKNTRFSENFYQPIKTWESWLPSHIIYMLRQDLFFIECLFFRRVTSVQWPIIQDTSLTWWCNFTFIPLPYTTQTDCTCHFTKKHGNFETLKKHVKKFFPYFSKVIKSNTGSQLTQTAVCCIIHRYLIL